MKAEDTVLTAEKQWESIGANVNSPLPEGRRFSAQLLTHMYPQVFEGLLKAQAEISFKAGIKEVVEWLQEYAIHGGKTELEDVLIALKAHSPYGKPS